MKAAFSAHRTAPGFHINHLQGKHDGRGSEKEKTPEKEQPLSLLQKGISVLLVLRVRVCHLPGLLCRKQMGHLQWPDLDLPGL